ncbi:hypothetical protein COJ96_10740 [Bacillus sp. AFS073361]|uniref:AAA family ATPase n=1 Tax=Bacillus sp. AFS073361 TaxID=2033511 RepID=UPI000BF8FAA9|nr:AAA family ATPase [Bacillus sp. AFS073361]PFP29373.1 hypothetical protein COJ96_10740 [Bacillus sp. AFS073361]
MNISIETLEMKNFKGHKSLTINLGEVNQISGKNGQGKSSIGEAITWSLYGTDTMGNSLDPTPLYEHDGEVRTSLVLRVDDKKARLTRAIENGKNAFYINEVPKKATEYKELIDSLFTRELFLSIFNPSFFPSQHWKEQRNQLLKYIQEPLNKEVLANLPNVHSDAIAEALKKHSLEELDKLHRDRFKKRDKELERASERVLTLKEQFEKSTVDGLDLKDIHTRWVKVDEEIKMAQKKNQGIATIDKKLMELDIRERVLKEQIMKRKNTVEGLQQEPVQENCLECGQPLDAHSKDEIENKRLQRLNAVKQEGRELVNELNEIKKAKSEIEYPGDPIDVAELIEEANKYRIILMDSKRIKELGGEIQESEAQREKIRADMNQSLVIIEAIKAFSEKKANMVVEKVNSLFGTLSVKLFEQQKNGELKQTFELEMDGKPYTKLSTAEKVKAGIELIYVIQEQSGIISTTFIDNAESVLNLKYAPGQTIISTVKNNKLKIEGAN